MKCANIYPYHVGISAGDVYNQDFNTTTISKTVGDMLTINFDVSGKINLLICFSQNLSNSFTLNENDCVKCSANHRYHQCVNYEGFPTVNFQSFQITFDHSLCTLDYHLTIFKHHLTIADNGTLIFAEYNGEIYKTFKNVELLVNNHSYDYVYGTLTIAIAIILSIVLFVICQKMKKISKSRGVIRQTLRSKFVGMLAVSIDQLRVICDITSGCQNMYWRSLKKVCLHARI